MIQYKKQKTTNDGFWAPVSHRSYNKLYFVSFWWSFDH